MLEISIGDRDAIVSFAARSDVEVCGLLLGTGTGSGATSGGRVTRIVPCANVAADPARRFEIDPAALIAAHRAARAGGGGGGGGERVIGHYHSHPSGIARPSPRDAADAAADGSFWLIAAGGVVTAWRARAAGAVHGRFDPVPLATFGCAGGDEPSQGRIAAISGFLP